ncbi:polysaccharide deacetylase family protein [Pyxidicoccus parkwayensis]|uniref:polysaccharide deacetylase family protein n=1 Tax=Pyxidicoccus parkwayensis TaxID=2813578 RepID=UPI001F5123E7|nr:polysaccharide deacetylase family protein [Pyxidicoccus parkwaysis]
MAGPLFARYGMHATFYVNSGRVGASSSYLSLADLRSLAAAGHEIGGHTVDHVDLSTVPAAEARHQICDCRADLMAMGFPVTSFAYPFGSDTPTARLLVIDCNYNSARATGGIKNPYGCSSCPPAETIPPADVFLMRTPPSVESDWTLADLQSLVLQAEAAGGGYIQVSLHEICDGCGTYSIKESLLDAFLAWLAPRASRGTFVMTTNELIGGAVKPPVYSDGGTFPFDAGTFDAGTGFDAGTPDAGPADGGVSDGGVGDGGTNLLRNPSLETDTNSDNVPDCWRRVNTGSTSGGWSRTSDAHTGSWAQTARIASLSSGADRRLIVMQDTGTCSPVVTPGHTYRVSAWYKTPGSAVFVASYRTSSGWVEWATSPVLPTSTPYRLAEWTTPPVPAGALNISVGLALRSVASMTMDDFSLVDVSAGPTPDTLHVVTPNGGESLTTGSTYDIRWDSTGTWSSVGLAYSTDLGTTWTTIVTGAPNTGRYTWTIPTTTTTRGLVRISSTSAPFVSDTSDAAFTIVPPPSGPAIPLGSTWKYNASGTDPGASWNLPSYVDSAWPSGAAELGYGDGDERTVIPKTTPSQSSVYFRKKVTLGAVSAASLRVKYDDGVAVYVNGTLVYSVNMANGLGHSTYASASTENAVSIASISPAAFVAGENTIAVMVKQVGPTSPDLSFDLELSVTP